MRLLIAEDDVTTAESLVRGFSAEGYDVRWAKTADDALASLAAQPVEVVVLDWMLPGKSGVEVLQTLRTRGQRVPVLLLTARDAITDRVAGLESGADDYLTKPFAFAELLARVRALLRRAQPAEPLLRSVSDLTVDRCSPWPRKNIRKSNWCVRLSCSHSRTQICFATSS